VAKIPGRSYLKEEGFIVVAVVTVSEGSVHHGGEGMVEQSRAKQLTPCCPGSREKQIQEGSATVPKDLHQ
jgi:hypothetical protein